MRFPAIRPQPASPYLLTETVIVQDQALQGANQRIEQLEARVKVLEADAQKGAGSFLGGLVGGGATGPNPSAPPPSSDQPQGGPCRDIIARPYPFVIGRY